jgi:hypothetical protein
MPISIPVFGAQNSGSPQAAFLQPRTPTNGIQAKQKFASVKPN